MPLLTAEGTLDKLKDAVAGAADAAEEAGWEPAGRAESRPAQQQKQRHAWQNGQGASEPGLLDLPHRPAGGAPASDRRSPAQPAPLDAMRRHPAAGAAATLAVSYVGLRLAIAGFHRLRRRFLRQLLLDLVPALEACGATFWLDFGCLLGITRDGDLILHDNDVDLAVYNPNWPQLLDGLRALLPPRYSIKVVTPQGQPASTWIRVYCPLGMADLFGAYPADNGDTVAVDCGHGDTMHIDASMVLPTSRKKWKGTFLPVPADVEGTLARRYGPTWRTPQYMEKGADDIEGSKPYACLFKALAKVGIRI